MHTVHESEQSIDAWEQFAHPITVDMGMTLRLQLNALNPGAFWFDDIRVEAI